MPDPLPIEGRAQRVKCAKNTSDLYMLQADVHEGIGIVTEIEVEFLTQSASCKARDFLADEFTIELDVKGSDPRKWIGTCVECTYLGVSEGMGYGEYPHFKATIRGWPWLLTRITDCKIFQDMNADDIVKQVLQDAGFSDMRWGVNETPPVREYCVQYRETSWNFVQRLLAEEGRFWYFDYSGGKDQLVICDDSATLSDIPGESTIELMDKEAGAREEIDYIDNWKANHRFETDKVTLDDFDFKKSNTALSGTRQNTPNSLGTSAKYEEFDYPGLYLENSAGTKLARRRMEAITAATHRVMAEGIAKRLHAGGKFTLDKHPREAENVEHLVLEAHHSLKLEKVDQAPGGKPDAAASIFDKLEHNAIGGRLGRGLKDFAKSDFGKSLRKVAGKKLASADEKELMELQSVRFEALPADVPYVPPPVPVPYPVISGVQTAKVVGPEGEEIYTDEFGRVKVQFHWDRYGEDNENSTCWIRVATPIAGKNWGMIHIPRIGQEVVVQFLEGNPDRPLIVGSVYNDQQTVPFGLPDNKTRIGLVSDTHQNEDASARHELWFEEKKDAELMRMQSERDWELHVKNSADVNIGTEDKPDGDYNFKVWRHTTRSYGEGSGEGNVEEVIQNNFTKKLHDGDYDLDIESGKRITNVATDDERTVGGKDDHTITGNQTNTIKGKQETTVAQSIKITANQKIELICGGSKVTIGPAEIKLESPQIKVSAQGIAEVSSPMTTVKGSGLLTLQGGLTKIN